MAELHIPPAAAHAMIAVWDDWESDAELIDACRAVARPVVAAELRRMADELDRWAQPDSILPDPATVHAITARLRRRANDLDRNS